MFEVEPRMIVTADGMPTSTTSFTIRRSNRSRAGFRQMTVSFVRNTTASRYTRLQAFPIAVARPAPTAPMPSAKMKTGSITRLIRPPSDVPMLACFVFPSARIRFPSSSDATEGTPPITTVQRRYPAAARNASSVRAPTTRSSGLIDSCSTTAMTAIRPIAPQNAKVDAFRAVSRSSAPSERDIRLFAPMPNRFPTMSRTMKIGKLRVSAATCDGSFVCPTKNVSARL